MAAAPNGLATIIVNAQLPEAKRRYAMARALFVGLCATKAGQTAGLPTTPNPELKAQSDLFARQLLLPPRWAQFEPHTLAALCGVPESVAAAHLLTRPQP